MSSNTKNERPYMAAVRQRVAVSAAASLMTGSVLVSIGLLFAAPKTSAETASPRDKPVSAAIEKSDPVIERGRYLVQIGGCNDCHTDGYVQVAGKLPDSEWLTGWAIGFRGPWGTSYAPNLRLTVAGMTEDQWLTFARAPRLPPMPWFNLRDMSDEDLRAIYRFVRDLGPKGERMPAAVPQGQPVNTPFIVFEPKVETVASRQE